MDYTDLYNFVSSTGIIVPSDSSVLLGIQSKFQEIFGTDIDLSAETPVGRLIEAFAVVVKSTLGVTAQAANQFNVNEATGIYLDSIAQIYDLKRIAGTKTRITIKCFFSQAVTDPIPAGSLILESGGGELFSIDSTIENKGEVDEETGQYCAIGSATAIEVGPVVASIGSVNSIQTGVVGWTGVTNIAPTYIGTNIESDESFRKRILHSRPIGIGFTTHLESALNRMDGVYSNCILENNTGTPVVKRNVVIPAHSVYVGIDCIETEELYQTIAKEIANCKSVGCGMVSEGVPGGTLVTRSVQYGYGNENVQNISFYKADKRLIYVDLKYRTSNYSGSNIESDVRAAIADYIGTVSVGGTIYSSNIATELINRLKISIVTIGIMKAVEGATADTVVELDGYEVPYTDAQSVSMEMVL